MIHLIINLDLKHRQMRKIRVKGKKVKNRCRYFNRRRILPLANDTSEINEVGDTNIKETKNAVTKNDTKNGVDETFDTCMTPGVNSKRSVVEYF